MAARNAAVVIISRGLCICASFILVDFGMSSRRCNRSLLGARLETRLVATISAVIFFSFSPCVTPSLSFLIDGVLRSKNLFSKSCSEYHIYLGYTSFRLPSAFLGRPGDHFGFYWWFYACHRGSARIENLFSESCSEQPGTKEYVSEASKLSAGARY